MYPRTHPFSTARKKERDRKEGISLRLREIPPCFHLSREPDKSRASELSQINEDVAFTAHRATPSVSRALIARYIYIFISSRAFSILSAAAELFALAARIRDFREPCINYGLSFTEIAILRRGEEEIRLRMLTLSFSHLILSRVPSVLFILFVTKQILCGCSTDYFRANDSGDFLEFLNEAFPK